MFGLGIYHPSGHKFAVHSNVTLWIPNVSHGSHTLHQEPFYSTPPCLVDNPFVATVVSLQRVYIHGVCAVTSSFTLLYSYLPLCDCVTVCLHLFWHSSNTIRDFRFCLSNFEFIRLLLLMAICSSYLVWLMVVGEWETPMNAREWEVPFQNTADAERL